MQLTKLLNYNLTTNIISSHITEYDLKAAHLSAMSIIRPEIYKNIVNLPKSEYTITIGKMIRDEPNLRTEIDKVILKWFNDFIVANKIIDKNVLATTADSILINNQIATKTTFDNVAIFRNKEQISYTSLFVIDRTKFILFDRMSRRIRIKGLGNEDVEKDWPFVKKCLRSLCAILDDSPTIGRINSLRKLKIFRINFLNSDDIEIYRSIDNKNMFKYVVDGKTILSDIQLTEGENCQLVKSDNYMNYILPLFQSFI